MRFLAQEHARAARQAFHSTRLFFPFFTFFEKMDFINLLGVRVLDRNVTVIHSLLKREALIDVSQKVRMVTAKARAASAVSFHFREIVNERTTHRWK